MKTTLLKLYLCHLVRNFACIFKMDLPEVNPIILKRFPLTFRSQTISTANILNLIEPSLVRVRFILNSSGKSSLISVCSLRQEKQNENAETKIIDID